MSSNIDIAIFVAFLAINLGLGLFYSRNIKNISEYAVGHRNFSTATIVATIVATWLFGSSIALNLYESYQNGLYFIIPGVADGFSFFVVAYFYAPRMREFLGNLSVAEAMGNIYGKKVRMVTGISAIIPAIGNIALQFSILILILTEFLGIPSAYAIIGSSFIVITYSTFGGIKAVTFTDVIQFFTFGVVIPMLAFIIWRSVDNSQAVVEILNHHPNFNIKEFFDIQNPRFLDTLVLFLFFLIPGLDPAIFQRIAIAKNTFQVSKSFYISGIIIICCYLTLDFTGLLLIADNAQGFDQSNVVGYVLNNYMSIGFKGIFIIGLTAMLMSTADSYINCAAVIFSNDLCRSIGIELNEKRTLLLARFSAFLIGVCGLTLSLYATNILSIILSTYCFYMPIVSVPLLLAIFGFRSSSRAVLIGMAAGFITVILFKQTDIELDSIIPGMIANIVVFISSHYILREPGGWVKTLGSPTLSTIDIDRKAQSQNISKIILNFNFIDFCKNNVPKDEKFIAYVGLFNIVSIFSSIHILSEATYSQYHSLINTIHYTVLIISTCFIIYPAWNLRFKQNILFPVAWNLSLIFSLVAVNILLFMLGNFSQPLLMTITLANLIILAVLLRWHVAIGMMLIGIFASIKFYQYYTDLPFSTSNINLQFQILYPLIFVASILIAFLKPKQEYQALTEERNKHLGNLINAQEQRIKEALSVRSTFIRNVNHEYRAPMSGIITMAQLLAESYDMLTDSQRRDAAQSIFKSVTRLDRFDADLTSLSALSQNDPALNIKEIDLSSLVYDRLNICRKLYEENKEDREFILNIEEEAHFNGDEDYITQALDNLIINAITYCQKGKVEISLSKKSGLINFMISDEGIGIPTSELYDIFDEFTVSSKTNSLAGGRGIGLTLCKKVIELHGGNIKAESDGKSGARFTFTIPQI